MVMSLRILVNALKTEHVFGLGENLTLVQISDGSVFDKSLRDMKCTVRDLEVTGSNPSRV